ncbi:GNAT family N-acetyltransferase [Sphingomonas sp. H39-1-10]|uniref:GNAT family N-acetyltransferase n=1 Tax=Sphingomonas pollutisoli TaxID=3030829 RepID=UPI0023B9DCD3|nr:GNAT family N-acetyltransferase [Sphingomonas pollutisoli]MDF0487169.1 GNAT family N-acetyltransferase [Sphingomonas pollutisoli]
MIETARLVLRRPVAADLAPLHAMWSDPRVMADLGPLKTREQSAATIARHEGYRQSHGLGFWTVALREDGTVIGFCGLKPGAENTPIAGEVEVGWMLAAAHWRQGFAREAAEASLAWGWANSAAPRIVAITAAQNAASRALMERLGMVRLGGFDHPNFAVDDPLRETVSYAIERA